MTSWINLQNKSFWPKVFFKVFGCCWRSYRSLYRLQFLFRENRLWWHIQHAPQFSWTVWRHRSLFLVLYAHLAKDITNNYYNTLLYIVLIIWCIVFSVAKSLQLKFKNQRNPTTNYENGDFDAVSAFNHGAKLCRAALEEWSNTYRIDFSR